MHPDQLPEYRKLRERLFASRGWYVRGRVESLNRSYDLFARNHAELFGVLQGMRQQPVFLQMWDINNRDELRAAMDEVGRLLHNLVSSVKSLEDHTRVVVEELYALEPWHPEYQNRIHALAANPLVKFVRDLRRFTTHRELPAITAKLAAGDAFTSSMHLSRERLLEWNGWTSPSRKYLASLTSDPDLFELAAHFRVAIEDFYSWLGEKQASAYTAEFSELRSLHEQISAMENGSAPTHS